MKGLRVRAPDISDSTELIAVPRLAAPTASKQCRDGLLTSNIYTKRWRSATASLLTAFHLNGTRQADLTLRDDPPNSRGRGNLRLKARLEGTNQYSAHCRSPLRGSPACTAGSQEWRGRKIVGLRRGAQTAGLAHTYDVVFFFSESDTSSVVGYLFLCYIFVLRLSIGRTEIIYFFYTYTPDIRQ